MYFRLAQDSCICILRAKLPQLRHNTPDLGWRAKEGSGLAGSAGKKIEGASDSRPLGEQDGRRSGSPPALAPVPFQEIRYVVLKSRSRVREWHELTMTFPRLSLRLCSPFAAPAPRFARNVVIAFPRSRRSPSKILFPSLLSRQDYTLDAIIFRRCLSTTLPVKSHTRPHKMANDLVRSAVAFIPGLGSGINSPWDTPVATPHESPATTPGGSPILRDSDGKRLPKPDDIHMILSDGQSSLPRSRPENTDPDTYPHMIQSTVPSSPTRTSCTRPPGMRSGISARLALTSPSSPSPASRSALAVR